VKTSENNWVKNIVEGAIVCAASGSLLSLALRVFFPEVVEEKTTVTVICVATIWLVAVLLGVVQILIRKRAKK